MKRNFLVIVAFVAFVALLGMAGQIDFEDEARAHLLYCDNVANGVWPDYDKIYDSECTPERIAEIEEILR